MNILRTTRPSHKWETEAWRCLRGTCQDTTCHHQPKLFHGFLAGGRGSHRPREGGRKDIFPSFTGEETEARTVTQWGGSRAGL